MTLPRVCVFVFLLVLCAAVGSPAYSQDVTVGLRNGVVQSTVEGDLFYPALQFEGGQVQRSLRTGLQVTGFWAVPLSDRFSVQVEAQYAQKGVVIRGEWIPDSCGGPLVNCITPSLDGTYQMSFVQLPVLLTWRQPLGQGLGLRMLAGPSFDLLVDTRITTAWLHESALPENARTPRSNQALGAVGGVQVEYDVPSGGALQLGARFHPALTGIDVIGAETTLRSRAFVLNFGYAFQL